MLTVSKHWYNIMFTLQNLNVVRIVDSEQEKAHLLANGFIEIVENSDTVDIEPKTKDTKKSKV